MPPRLTRCRYLDTKVILEPGPIFESVCMEGGATLWRCRLACLAPFSKGLCRYMVYTWGPKGFPYTYLKAQVCPIYLHGAFGFATELDNGFRLARAEVGEHPMLQASIQEDGLECIMYLQVLSSEKVNIIPIEIPRYSIQQPVSLVLKLLLVDDHDPLSVDHSRRETPPD